MPSLKTVLTSVGILVAALVADPLSASAATTWSVDQGLAVPTYLNGELDSISCSSATSCVSVGSYRNRSGAQATLIESLSGGAWHIVKSPNPPNSAYNELYGVSCGSATSCVAVGYTQTGYTPSPVIEVLSGGSWSLVAVPTPSGYADGYLNGVSCVSATSCVAVGGYDTTASTTKPLILKLSSGTWSVMSAANAAGSSNTSLNGVSCTAANACVGVGSSTPQGGGQRAFVEVLAGNSWTATHTPVPTGSSYSNFRGVSCTSTTACVAVGNYSSRTGATKVLAEQLSGTAWSVSHTANPQGDFTSLNGVSCASATSCQAVGVAQSGNVAKPVVETMSGTTWTLASVQKPTTTDGGYLNGVSCLDATTCTAVGLSTGDLSAQTPLTEILNGTHWSITATPKGTGAQGSQLLGVNCPTTTACIAVGSNNDAQVALAETWNGSTWSLTPAPPVPSGGSGGALWSASCTSATNCMAVGNYGTDSGARAMADLWNGSTWTATTPAVPSGASSVAFFSVSCTDATTCFAVGNVAVSNQSHGVAEKWNGTSWSLLTLPVPSGSSGEFLYGVSCSSATSCVAGGDYFAPGGLSALAEVWNGTSWSVSNALPSASGASVNAVSCSSSTFCMIAGYGGGRPFADVWNGSVWTSTSPLVQNGADSSFSGVSCVSATSCTAVGNSNSDAGADALAEEFNGTTWTLDVARDVHGASQTELEDVSCAAVSVCRAVGSAYLTTNVPVGEYTG